MKRKNNALKDRLFRMRTFMRANRKDLPSPFPPVVLFFSVSDGDARAHIARGAGKSLEAAWQEGLAAFRRIIKKRRLKGRWIRVDRVEHVQATTWKELEALLENTRRNYFRLGLTLDRDFNFAFTEQELNANAMLYGGNTIGHAVVNKANFSTYMRSKYQDPPCELFVDEDEVFLFSTRGAFCDEDGEIHELVSSGRDSGRRKVDQLTEDNVLPLIRSGSDYLARQVNADGTFVYGCHPCFDRCIDTYNALRHASTTYSLVEAWEVTREPPLLEAIERALVCLSTVLIREIELPTGSQAAFLVDVGDEIKLGGNAVAILAMTKYCAVTGTEDYLPLAKKLANGIKFMQDKGDGSFTHILNYPDLAIKQAFRTIYYEGEAAFGLLRLYEMTQDPTLLESVEKAFEHFIANDHWKHHDHWFSYCVNELTRYRPEERYYRSGIRNFSNHLDFVLERITTFPTLLELMMAAEAMIARIRENPELHHLLGELDLGKFYRALHARAHYLLNGYFWPEFAMYFRNPNRIVGSFFIRHHAFRVRIDDVEHYLSGFVGYRKFLLRQAVTPEISAPVDKVEQPLSLPVTRRRISFLNRDMGHQRSGVENAALLRAEVFARGLGIAPTILTCKYNPQLRDAEADLRSANSLPQEVEIDNMYDDFQDADSFDPERHRSVDLLRPELHPEQVWIAVPNSADFRVTGQDGGTLIYVAHDRTTGKLRHVNHFCNRRKWRRDIYDCRGFLSRIQFLEEPGARLEHEIYLRPDGTIAIIKKYTENNSKRRLRLIQVVERNGQSNVTLDSEASLVEYWLNCRINSDDARHIFFIDKNLWFYEPAVAVRDSLPDPSRLMVIPIIHALHTRDHLQPGLGLENRNYVAIFRDARRPDAIVTMTEAQANDIRQRYGTSAVHAIGHAYDSRAPALDFSRRDRCKVIYIARYSPEKRHETALRAFKLVVEQCPDATLHCYGSGSPTGPTLMMLRRLVDKLDLASSVFLHGWLEDTASAYEGAGLAICASQAESYSLTIMESLCHGCPVIAFNVPYGPGTLIRDGINGFLVSFADESAFAQRIISVLLDENLHRELSAQARLGSERFSMSRAAECWSELLNSLSTDTAPRLHRSTSPVCKQLPAE